MTTTKSTCARPGCGGTIEGGYCDTCGLAPVPSQAASAQPAPSSATGPPDTSSYHEAAQIAAVRIQVASRPGPSPVSPDDLHQADSRLTRLKLDPIQMELLTAEVLRAALDCVAGPSAGGPPARAQLPGGQQGGGQLFGCDFTERALRFGLERSYRTQARLAADQRRRIELVDEANHVRPGTWS